MHNRYDDDDRLSSLNDDYSIEDEEEDYIDGEEKDDEEGMNEKAAKSHSPLILMFGMMLNPVEGWKKIRRAGISPERMASGCFYPLVAALAASCFIQCIYDNAYTLSMGMVDAVKYFVALFFGNFLALMFLKLVMPGKYKNIADSTFGRELVMYLLSTLALFGVLYHCLPMLGPVLSFLPLWTIYLAIRGIKFFRFPAEKSNLLTTLVCVAVIVSPFVIYQIFDIVL